MYRLGGCVIEERVCLLVDVRWQLRCSRAQELARDFKGGLLIGEREIVKAQLIVTKEGQGVRTSSGEECQLQPTTSDGGRDEADVFADLAIGSDVDVDPQRH